MPIHPSRDQKALYEPAQPAARRSEGGMAGMLAAITMLVLVAIAAFWVIGTGQPGGETAMAAEGHAAAEVEPRTRTHR